MLDTNALQAETPEQEFERYYARYFAPIRHLLLNTTTLRFRADGGSVVDDLTQQAFLKAWRGWRRFAPRHELARRDWLYVIAQRVYLDWRRHERLVQMESWDGTSQPAHFAYADRWRVLAADPAPPPDDGELEAHVQRVLERLPVHTQACWRLLADAGLRYDQIAERVGGTRCVVKSRLFRARLALRADPAVAAHYAAWKQGA